MSTLKFVAYKMYLYDSDNIEARGAQRHILSEDIPYIFLQAKKNKYDEMMWLVLTHLGMFWTFQPVGEETPWV